MAFSVIYPTDQTTTIPRALFVVGTLGLDSLTVNGRLISYGPTTIRYPDSILYTGSNIWMMLFKNLKPGTFYDLQVLNQDGTVLKTLTRLVATGPLTGINILSPGPTESVCTDFPSVGTTVNPPMECIGLEWVKLIAGDGSEFPGEVVEVTDFSWAVQFMGVPDGTYTMEIGHCADGNDAVGIPVTVSAAKCGPPIPSPIPIPIPIPDPSPSP